MSEIYKGIYESPIGIIEIVCTEEEVISLQFVDQMKDDANENDLVEKALLQLDEYFKGKRTTFDLMVHLDGTDFQKTSWSKLLDIPYGTTCTYKDLANMVGSPKAYRAVGNANNKNKIAIIIPCHRVIGASGKLVGYAGGLEKKKWLLEHEQKFK